MDPTIYQDPFESAASRSAGVSRAKVGFVIGDRPDFSNETSDLLRQRLTAVTLAMLSILGLVMLGSLLTGISALVGFRVLAITVLGGCLVALRSARPFSLSQLRNIELVVFGTVIMQLSLMCIARIHEFTELDDATSVIALKYAYWAAWSLMILIYGIFMPNSWRRGAVVMLSMACVPYLLLAIQSWWSPDLASLLSQEKNLVPIPLPFVAALVGVYGTHTINSVRREAFKSRQFGQYRLLDKLGSGGMGEVYRAEHILLKRPCAMKLIKPEKDVDRTAIARFETEVKATAKLTHWNTIEIYDYGHTEDGTFYYVMELLPGMSLQELVERHGILAPGRVIYLLRQVCGALDEAHSVGLIHRDIKPANIFVAQRGNVDDVAKLLDFGLVKERNAAGPRDGASIDGASIDGGRKVGRGTFSGTPLYMSPEQATSYDSVDGRSDIYALGAVAYFLLTGRPPFSGRSMVQLLTAHANRKVTPPSCEVTDLPKDLEQVVLRCLEKNPHDRFDDASSLSKALDACQCAADWTPEIAAQWWVRHGDHAEPVQPGKKTVTAVTVELSPGETIDE